MDEKKSHKPTQVSSSDRFRLQYAVSNGDASAMTALGMMYVRGMDIKQDYKKAIELFEKAAELKNSEAANNLGVIYERGYGVPIDYAKARKNYQDAVDLKSIDALFNLGTLYLKGMGCQVDYNKAFELFQRAAEQGNKSAIHSVGLMYVNGFGVEKSYARAKNWFLQSADLGFSDSMLQVGLIYVHGLETDINYNQAYYWFEQASKQNNVMAIYNIGVMYAWGYGITRNFEEAHKWFEKAAQLGDENAMHSLGVMYENAFGVAKDYTRAKSWYLKAIEKNHPHAMVNLGLMYDNGEGVEQDHKKALELYQKAVDLGDSQAMLNIGVMYDRGEGLPKNEEIANQWFEKAANAGQIDAMLYFADLNLTSQKINESRVWLEKAAIAGHDSSWIRLLELDYINNDSNANTAANLDDTSNINKWLDSYIQIEIKKGTLHQPSTDVLQPLSISIFRCLAIIRLLSQWQQSNNHLITNNTVLHHFTRFDVIEKLLPTSDLGAKETKRNILRCYHVSYMNDPTEGRRLLDYSSDKNSSASTAANALRYWFDSKDGYFHQLDNAITVEDIPSSVFTASFTERSDNLDLWRAYGNDGKGISICLPVNGSKPSYVEPKQVNKCAIHNQHRIVNTPSFSSPPYDDSCHTPRFYRIKYDDKSVADTLSNLSLPLKKLEEYLDQVKSTDEKAWSEWIKTIRNHITESILHILYLFKDENYSSEQEVRALTIHALTDEAIKRDERTPRHLYCELSNFPLFTKPGTEILTGPKVDNANAMIWDMRHLLTLHGYAGNVTVKRSKVKYR
ncbi:SEL1-like repeat protein [Aeromonas veronii]|uniref:SEL1-like repeat protein n=1 Tax=Aeromonas veronii TaxID=654 RepID=UPI0011165369|nr:tetratricopeptide repeat protein [Aeromonas veronii]